MSQSGETPKHRTIHPKPHGMGNSCSGCHQFKAFQCFFKLAAGWHIAHRFRICPLLTTGKIRYCNFLNRLVNVRVGNFWLYWHLPYSRDLERISKRVLGLDLLVDVTISLQILKCLQIGIEIWETYPKHILLQRTILPNPFPTVLGSLLNRSGAISIFRLMSWLI